MSRRSTITAFALATALALAGLIAAAAGDHRDTAFSPGVPDNVPVALLLPGQTLCQGPITAQATFSGVQAWLRPAHALDVEIRDARGGRRLAAGRIATTPTPTGEVTIGFGPRSVPRGTRFAVCLRNVATERLSLEGGPPTGESGSLEISGTRQRAAIALLFLRPHPPTLLALIPTVFRRASLFKLGWVGPWTFWLLLAGLLGAFAVAGVAVAEAVRADEDGR